MKKTLFAFLAALSIGAMETQAQGLLDLFKKTTNTEQDSKLATDQKAQNALSGLSGLGDFVAGLLGKDQVSKNSLVGTWNYKQPAVVFDSEDMLTNVGGMAAGKAAEQKIQEYLNKIGFTAGKMKIAFKEDGTGTVTYATKNIPFQWSVAETDLTIKLGSGTQSALANSTKLSSLSKYTTFKMNCKVNLTNIQLSFKADKLLDFVSKIVSTAGSAANNSTIATIAGLANKVDGMYLGLTLEK